MRFISTKEGDNRKASSRESIRIPPTGGNQVGNKHHTQVLDLSTQVTKGANIEERLLQCSGNLKVAQLSVPAAGRVGSRERLPRSEHHTLTAGGMRTAEIRSIKQTSFSGQIKFESSHPWQNPSKIFALQGINSQEVIKSITLFRLWKVLRHTPALLVFHTIHLKPLSPWWHLKRKFLFSASLKLPRQKPTGWML